MKKHLISSVAIATLSLGVTAQAEETTKPVATPNETNTVKPETKQVTETDVKQAEQALKEEQVKVSAQTKVVSEAQTDKDKAETTLKQAEQALETAEKLAKEATPETIEATKKEIVATEQAITEATQAITEAEQTLTTAQTDLSKQETVVSEAQTDKSKAEADVKQAESEVKKAQDLLDGTNSTVVINEAESAKADLEQAKQVLSEKEQDLVKAQEADKQRSESVASLTKEVTQATETSQTLEANYYEAVSKAEKTGATLDTAKAELTKTETTLESVNTIFIPKEYKDALTDYVNNYFEKGDEAEAIMNNMAESLRTKNKFKANPNDENVYLDTNNLSEEDLVKLSQFASDLINQIRRTFGRPETVVSLSAIKFADVVTDGYVTDNWTWEDRQAKGHDIKAINKGAKAFGLKTMTAEQEAKGRQYYENMNSISVPTPRITLAKAKELIHESIIDFMFNGFEYLHAESIAGFYSNHKAYLGVDLSSRSNITGVHFLQVTEDYFTPDTKFDTTVLANPESADNLIKAYESAKTVYEKALKADLQAKDQLQKATQAKNEAKANLETVKGNLAKVKATPAQTPSAQASLESAKAKLTQATDRDNKAQEAVKQLSADVVVKKDLLNKAKEALGMKKAVQAQAVAKLEKEKNLLTVLVKAVQRQEADVNSKKAIQANLAEKLSDKKKYLSYLDQAPAVLKSAKQRHEEAKKALSEKADVLEKEVKTLKGLERKEASLKEQHTKVLKAYQDLLEAKRQEQLAYEKAKAEKEGELLAPLVNHTGQITGFTPQSKPSVSMVSHKKQINEKSVAPTPLEPKANVLPKTNSVSSLWLTILGSVMTISNLAILKIKKENN